MFHPLFSFPRIFNVIFWNPVLGIGDIWVVMQMVSLPSEVYSEVEMLTKIGEKMVLTLKVQVGEKRCCCWMHSIPVSAVLVPVLVDRLRLPLLVCFGFCFVVYSRVCGLESWKRKFIIMDVLIAMWPWANYVTCLGLRCTICKMGIIWD